MSDKVAIVEYRRPSGDPTRPGVVEVVEDRWPGGQVVLRVDGWIVVATMHGDIAFYPPDSVVRARNVPGGPNYTPPDGS